MKVRVIFYSAVAAVILGLGAPVLFRSQTNNYARLVGRAQADLKAGDNTQALAESQKAIKMDPRRWEAYVVAGGALQLEKQYDKAIDDFTQALEYAPSEKKAAVKGMLEKCMKEKVTAQSKTNSTQQSASTGSPSMATTVRYLGQKLTGLRDSFRIQGQPNTVFNTTILSFSVASCRLTLSENVSIVGVLHNVALNETRDMRFTDTFSVDVSDLDPAKIIPYTYDTRDLVLQTKGGRKDVAETTLDRGTVHHLSDGAVQTDTPDSPTSASHSWLPIYVGSQDLTPHVAKAMKHLIGLCRQQSGSEPF